MKVSIIVPVYNVENYLRRCIDSLVNQTLKDIEIILVNDGSTDKSQNIIDEYKSKYPNKIISLAKKNGGLSDARNYAFPYCHGEYIGFVDSDDYVKESMYERMFEKAKQTNADLVICNYYKVYEKKTQLIKAKEKKKKKDMFLNGLAAVWNKIYKREIIEKYKIRFPKGINFEDTEFYCKLIPYVNKCEYIDEAFVYYIQRKGSISNSSNQKLMHMLIIWERIISYYKINGLFELYKEELEYFCIRVIFCSHILRLSQISSIKIRHKMALETLKKANEYFPLWRNNVYLKNINIRNIYIKTISYFSIDFYIQLFHIKYLLSHKA